MTELDLVMKDFIWIKILNIKKDFLRNQDLKILTFIALKVTDIYICGNFS